MEIDTQPSSEIQRKHLDHTPTESEVCRPPSKKNDAPTPSSLFSSGDIESDGDSDDQLLLGSRLPIRFFNEGIEVDTYGNPLYT